MKKAFVTLQQTLGLLNFINNKNQAFSGAKFKFDQESVVNKNAKKTHLQPPKMTHADSNRQQPESQIDDDKKDSKILNKNRAIKRIIDSSRDILKQNFKQNFKYEEPEYQGGKSFITQFNIHMKQHNRMKQQLFQQSREIQQQQREFIIENEEKQLQKIYFFTVCQDFRQILSVVNSKNRIDRNNIDMMIKAFKDCLIVLTDNQLRIYQGQDQDSPYKDVRFFQIENIDYFVQPYIFIAITVVKDKSTPPEFVYFKFDCHERQKKWDIALNCNYSTKRMKRQNKLFLEIYQQKQDKQQPHQVGISLGHGIEHIKKRDDAKSFQPDSKSFAKNILIEKSLSKGIKIDGQIDKFEKNGEKTEKDIMKALSPNKESLANFASLKNFQSIMKKRIQADQQKNTDEHHTEKNQNSMSESKNSVNPISPKNKTKGEEQKKNENIFLINRAQSEEAPNQGESKQQDYIVDPNIKHKIELKSKHAGGIKMRKPKFFSEKDKIVYLGLDELEYWDYEQDSKKKENKKQIVFKQIKSIRVKQKNSTIIFQVANKKIELLGKIEDIDDIVDWISLLAGESGADSLLITRDVIKKQENSKKSQKQNIQK